MYIARSVILAHGHGPCFVPLALERGTLMARCLVTANVHCTLPHLSGVVTTASKVLALVVLAVELDTLYIFAHNTQMVVDNVDKGERGVCVGSKLQPRNHSHR